MAQNGPKGYFDHICWKIQKETFLGDALYILLFSFMLEILQSLALEMEGTGVLIQEIDPGVVNTEMTKVETFFWG